MNANDIELALRSRAAFNDSVACIDADTRRRLRELRLRAQQAEPIRRTTARWAWPLGAALTAAMALVVFMPRTPHASAAPMPTTIVAVASHATNQAVINPSNTTSVSMAVSADAFDAADPEMLSDLDFYGWLAEQPANDSSGG